VKSYLQPFYPFQLKAVLGNIDNYRSVLNEAKTYTDSFGVLLKAKKGRLIHEVKPILNQLRNVGFYLKRELIADILKLSGEA